MGNISIEFGFENACAFGWDIDIRYGCMFYTLF